MFKRTLQGERNGKKEVTPTENSSEGNITGAADGGKVNARNTNQKTYKTAQDRSEQAQSTTKILPPKKISLGEPKRAAVQNRHRTSRASPKAGAEEEQQEIDRAAEIAERIGRESLSDEPGEGSEGVGHPGGVNLETQRTDKPNQGTRGVGNGESQGDEGESLEEPNTLSKDMLLDALNLAEAKRTGYKTTIRELTSLVRDLVDKMKEKDDPYKTMLMKELERPESQIEMFMDDRRPRTTYRRPSTTYRATSRRR